MQVGHLEHVRHVEELEQSRGNSSQGGGGGGGGSSSEMSSAGGAAGGSTPATSLGSTPAGTAFKARDVMLAAGGGGSNLDKGGNKQGAANNNPLLATLFRQVSATALTVFGKGTNSGGAPIASSRELPPVSLAALPRWVLALGDASEEAAAVWDLDNADVGAVHLSMVGGFALR